MTLEEYQKLLEEKRKALQSLKTEERKVDTKEFETMQALSCKKDNFEIFAKLVGTFSPTSPPLLINIFFLYGVRAILTNIVLHFYLRCRDLTRINAKRLLTRKRKLRRSCFVQLSCPCYFVFIFSPLPFYFKIC
jgi:hypothetical protein